MFWCRKKTVDLHVHSSYSDGSLTPSQLIKKAKKKGLCAMAITDHDSIEGLEEASLEAAAAGLEFIPGVEFSAKYPGTMHILGYFPYGGIRKIQWIVEVLKQSRRERNPKILKKLCELGYPIELEDVLRYARSEENISRVHFARALCDKGYAVSIREAFHRLLGDNKPAYVEKEKLSPREIIEGINSAGGVSVLAHPIYLNRDMDEVAATIKELKEYGLMGIEAYYSDNNRRETKFFLKLAHDLNLITTGGSDYHGANKEDLEMGIGKGNLKVPYSCVEQIKLAARSLLP